MKTYSSTMINYFSFRITSNGYEAKSLMQKSIIGGVIYETKDMYGMDSEASECVVCMVNKVNTLLKPCDHVCLCDICAETLRQNKTVCPICRTSKIL